MLKNIFEDMDLSAIEIGKWNVLKVIKETDFGIYIGDEVEEILMPTKWVPDDVSVGDEIKAFIYTDSEDRLIATTLIPKVERDQFAFLEVKDIAGAGAWLDWGLEKDLFVPFSEQRERMKRGDKQVVYVYLDQLTDRLIASSKIRKFINDENVDYSVGEKVALLVFEKGDLGYSCVVNNEHKGLVYHDQIFKKIVVGQSLTGYIKEVREDFKIDLSLDPIGIEKMDGHAQKVLDMLRIMGGSLPYHDKSSPEEIKEAFQISKRNFKIAIGHLYRNRRIKIEDDGISLL